MITNISYISEVIDKITSIDFFKSGRPDSASKDDQLVRVAAFIAGNSTTARKSLSRQAAQNTAFYPLVASDNMSKESAVTISKFLERKYAELIRIIVSGNDVINLDKGHTKAQLINRFKNDLGVGTVVGSSDNFAPSISRMFGAGESNDLHRSLLDILPFVETTCENIDPKLVVEFLKKNGSEVIKSANIVSEARKTLGDPDKIPNYVARMTTGEVKQVNDLSPLVIEIEIVYNNEKGVTTNTTLTMGIKSILHVVPNTEFLDGIGQTLKEEKFAFSLIQWHTGEISFWKDLVLGIKEAKKKSSFNRDKETVSSFFHSLTQQTRSNRFSQLQSGKDGAFFVPTTTLAVTMDDIESLKKKYGFDLFKEVNSVRSLLEDLNILGFLIVDESTDALYVFDDVHRKFQVTSIPKEKSENKNSDNLMKVLLASVNSRG
jgi:hypothetical protein